MCIWGEITQFYQNGRFHRNRKYACIRFRNSKTFREVENCPHDIFAKRVSSNSQSTAGNKFYIEPETVKSVSGMFNRSKMMKCYQKFVAADHFTNWIQKFNSTSSFSKKKCPILPELVGLILISVGILNLNFNAELILYNGSYTG